MHERRFVFLFIASLIFSSQLWAEEAVTSASNDACDLHVYVQENSESAGMSADSQVLEPQDSGRLLDAQIQGILEDSERPNLWSRLFIVVRLSCNSAGVAYSLIEASQVPLAPALIVGVAMGTLSAAQQLIHAQLTHWQTRHGLMPDARAREASFFEAFFLKEYSLHVLYLQALQSLQKALGLKPDWFSFDVFKAAGLSLISDGFLNVANTKATATRIATLKAQLEARAKTQELTEEDFKSFSKSVGKIWTQSRGTAVGISFTATVLALLYMENVGWAGTSLQALGAVGLGLSAYLFRGEISRYLCALRLSRLRK